MNYDHLTIMYSLPRSMTQWWRWFMSHGCHALHDPLARCSHPDQLKAIVDAAEGERMFIADTSAILFHDRFERLLPWHKRMYMHRNVVDVRTSLAKQHYYAPEGLLEEMRVRLFDRNNYPSFYFGEVTPRRAAEAFFDVTGETIEPYQVEGMLRHVVDTPLRQQYRNADHIRSLLLHKDPT